MRRALIVILVTACGGGSSGGPDGPPGPDGAPGDPFAPRLGTITIAEQDGRFDGSGNPGSAIAILLETGNGHPFHTESGRQGECRLLTWEPGACPTPCDGVCTASGCVAFPDALDAGTITFTGTHEPIEIERDPTTGRYYHVGTLPTDLFAAGATITATAAGGADLDGFALSAAAPEPLVAAVDRPHDLPDTGDATITWTPGGGDTVLLTLIAPNTSHGSPFEAIVHCASADDGSITVPAAFVDALGPIGGTPCLVGRECPPSQLTRYRAHRLATPAGDVELRVATEAVFYVRTN